MAGSDKIYYENINQYLEFRKFWLDTYKDQVIFLGEAIYLYPFKAFDTEEEVTKEMVDSSDLDITYAKKYLNSPIFHRSGEIQDLWIISYCDLPFVRDQIIQQYSDNWIGLQDYPLWVKVKFVVEKVFFKHPKSVEEM